METSKTKETEPLSCKECNLSFKFEYVLNEHKRCVHQNRDRFKIEGLPRNCIPCKTTFSTFRSLSFHNTQFHRVFPTKIIRKGCCPICGITTNKLQEHIWRIHEKPQIKCTMCEYITRNNFSMKDHFERKHTIYGSRITEQCPLCGKVTGNLKKHHTETNCGRKPDDVMDKVQCPQCNKTLLHKYALKKHINRSCNKVKDKHCPKCGYQTNSRGNMRLHVNTQHLGKATLSENVGSADIFSNFGVLCPKCGKLVGNIALHLNAYHKDVKLSNNREVSTKLSNVQDFMTCVECNYISFENNGLSVHMAKMHKTF